MLSVVVWRWGTRYGVEYVNKLRSALERHLHVDHQVFCITDDETGLHPAIIPVQMWDPRGLKRARRLRMFGGVGGLFGERILHMDIDCVVTGDITHLVLRHEPLVIWRCPPTLRYKGNDQGGIVHENTMEEVSAFNTSLILRDSNTLSEIWREYLADPAGVERRAQQARVWTTILEKHRGTTQWVARKLDPGDDDQAVVTLYALNRNPGHWGEEDGVYKWGRRGFADKAKLPENAAIVFMNGSLACNIRGIAEYPWIQEHWR